MTTEDTPGFNARLWRRFIAIARPYWLSGERWTAWRMLALLIVLLLGQTALHRHSCGGCAHLCALLLRA